MGYISFPGLDMTTEDMGLVLLREADFPPAAPRKTLVDVLGRDGSLDMSEWSGDVLYSDREARFSLLIGDSVSESDIWELLDGPRYDFELSWDPGYTYNGRFEVVTLDIHLRTFELKITAEPYKTMGEVTYHAQAAGGHTFTLPNGRARVQPTVEVYRDTVISFEDRSWALEAGAWTIDGFWLHSGVNYVSVDTAPYFSESTWASYASTEWGDLADSTWAEMQAGESDPPEGDEYEIFFSYEWKDL